MRTPKLWISMIAALVMIPTVGRAATPSDACDFVLLSASKAVDARKAGASADTISTSVRAENEDRRTFGANVPDPVIEKFLRNLFSGEYDRMSSGLEFFDNAGPYMRRLRAECLEHF